MERTSSIGGNQVKGTEANESKVFDLVSTMGDPYPSEVTFRRIREYLGPVSLFFDELKKIWHPAGWGWRESIGYSGMRKKVRRFEISTGGWSGNEDMIAAMRRNFFLWHLSWVQQRVGGHFIFEVGKDATVSALIGRRPAEADAPGAKGRRTKRA